jgi:hypothetical protein
LATQALRDIASGDEILVTYGEGYWLSRLMDLESLQHLLGKVKALKRAGGAVSGGEFGIRNAG